VKFVKYMYEKAYLAYLCISSYISNQYTINSPLKYLVLIVIDDVIRFEIF